MNRWYRAYEGTCTDPKLAEAAMMAPCSRSVSVASWHLILENACSLNDSGRYEITPRRIAAALCEPLSTIEMLYSSFMDLGLVDGTHVVAWARRQFESDSSTGRVREYRARKKAEEKAAKSTKVTDETLQGVSETAHRQRQRQNIPEADASGQASLPLGSTAVGIAKGIFDTGVSILTASGHENRQARSIIGRWRKTYSDSVVLVALSRCQVEQPQDPVAWMTKALKSEATRAAGDAPQAQQQPARQSVSQIGARLAAAGQNRIAING